MPYEDAPDRALARHSQTLTDELHSLSVAQAAALEQLEAARRKRRRRDRTSDRTGPRTERHELVPLRTLAIPAHLHAGGELAYGTFSPLPTELVVRNASGATIVREDLSRAAAEATETCEGEAEGQ